MLSYFFNPFLLGYFILPASLLALVIGFYKYRFSALTTIEKAKRTGLVSAGLVFVGFAGYIIYVISISTNSTAILGVIDIPFAGIPLALFAYIVEWALAYLVFSRISKESNTEKVDARRKISALAIVVFVILFGAVESFRTARVMTVSKSSDPSEIESLYTSFLAQYDKKLLWEIALNEHTPEQILYKLAQDSRESIIERVAQNPAASSDTLRFLYGKDDSNLLYALAVNPTTPLDILIELSKSDNDTVRSNSTYNPNLPIEILCALSKETKGIVASSARQNIKERSVQCP